jgi:hypothetical protein
MEHLNSDQTEQNEAPRDRAHQSRLNGARSHGPTSEEGRIGAHWGAHWGQTPRYLTIAHWRIGRIGVKDLGTCPTPENQ